MYDGVWPPVAQHTTNYNMFVLCQYALHITNHHNPLIKLQYSTDKQVKNDGLYNASGANEQNSRYIRGCLYVPVLDTFKFR